MKTIKTHNIDLLKEESTTQLNAKIKILKNMINNEESEERLYTLNLELRAICDELDAREYTVPVVSNYQPSEAALKFREDFCKMMDSIKVSLGE